MATPKKPSVVNWFDIKPSDDQKITIGQLAESVTKLTGLRCTPSMIYNYEKNGLLSQVSRSKGNFRLFPVQDVYRVACIKRWQAQGLSLDSIKERIDGCSEEVSPLNGEIDLPADRSSQILQAAVKIFPKKGYDATTIQDIAQEAGVASSSIYQHFGSKEGLFLALADNISFLPVLDEINKTLNEQEDNTFEDVRRSLIKVGEAFSRSHMKSTEIVRMFFTETRNFPEIGSQYCARLVAPTEKLLAIYLSAQVKRGILRPVNIELAVHGFFGLFSHFHIVETLLNGEKVMNLPKQNRAEQLVDFFLLGLTSPEKVEPSDQSKLTDS